MREPDFTLVNSPSMARSNQNGWVVRVWLELTDDGSSALVVRRDQFDKRTEQLL